jgi:multiple sugar transport system permease protein
MALQTTAAAAEAARPAYADARASTWTRVKPFARILTIVVLGAAFAFPIYWTVTMSFKPLPEWNPPGKVFWWPDNPTVQNYEKILGIEGEKASVFATSRSRSAIEPIVNSVVASVGGTLLALAVGISTAYGIARFRAGGRMLPFQILQLRMFPPIAIVIPLLFMFVEIDLWNREFFGWLNLGLILLYGAVTFPFVVWLMRSFFQEVPREISEAAIVDGCTQWGAFFKAVLPQVKGGLAATALFVFILNWSDFLIAKVMTQDTGATAPVYLQSLQGGASGNEYGLQAALAMFLILPPAIFGLAIQRYLVRGLTFGAIKR